MLKNIFLVLFAIFLLIVLISFFQIHSETQDSNYGGNISVYNISRIGNYAYVLMSSSGKGNVTLLTYSEKPSSEIFILNDKGIGMTNFDNFVSNIKSLEEKGFSVKLSGSTVKVNHGVYIVATGAMPFYVFDSIKDTSSTIIYIGKKDLFLEGGNIKSRNWYDELSPEEKNKIIIYEKTLDEFLENKTDLSTLILENSWHLKNKKFFQLNQFNHNITTLSISVANTSETAHVRIFYNLGKNSTRIIDSQQLAQQQFAFGKELNVLPDEKFEFEANLNKTNGSAYFVIEKDRKEVSRIKEKRIVDEGIIYERLSFGEPGDYVIKLEDNSGVLGGTIVHVKKVEITLKERRPKTFVFSISLDDNPVDRLESTVSLNNGTAKVFTINNGELSVNAKLNKGNNEFSFLLFGSLYKVQVENNYEDAGEIYFKYGVPGLVLVLIVYIFARLSRKPTYIIRVGNVARDVRQELKLQTKQAIDLFKLARQELSITGPLTVQEFSFILKRNFTEGADITEGNVEEILKELGAHDIIQHKRGYYQLKDDGDLVKNVMVRVIREKLIERGINFTLKNNMFFTTSYQICLLGNKISDKAIFVYDNETEFKNWFDSLSEKERAAIKIKKFNGSLIFSSLDKIDDVL